MPLPTSINDLSTSQPSNSPAGTENPQTFDDYLRWHASFIAALRDVVVSGTGNLSTANLTYSGTLTGSTGVLNIGAGQIYKDAAGLLGLGTPAPTRKLTISGSGAFNSAAAPAIRLDNTTSGRLALIDFDSSDFLNIWASDAGAGGIKFLTGTGTGVVRVNIAAAGNVTINAPSSGAALTVSGGLRVDAATTAAAPTGGAAGALPALPVGYVTINIGGTDRKIPFYT